MKVYRWRAPFLLARDRSPCSRENLARKSIARLRSQRCSKWGNRERKRERGEPRPVEFWREEFASIDRFLEIRSSPSVKTVPSPSSDLKRGEGEISRNNLRNDFEYYYRRSRPRNWWWNEPHRAPFGHHLFWSKLIRSFGTRIYH